VDEGEQRHKDGIGVGKPGFHSANNSLLTGQKSLGKAGWFSHTKTGAG
jgi:hypothetical protein